MATILADACKAILREALASELGIQVLVESAVEIANPAQRAKAVLYRFKNEDAAFADLHIKFHPTDPLKRLWILKGSKAEEAKATIKSEAV